MRRSARHSARPHAAPPSSATPGARTSLGQWTRLPISMARRRHEPGRPPAARDFVGDATAVGPARHSGLEDAVRAGTTGLAVHGDRGGATARRAAAARHGRRARLFRRRRRNHSRPVRRGVVRVSRGAAARPGAWAAAGSPAHLDQPGSPCGPRAPVDGRLRTDRDVRAAVVGSSGRARAQEVQRPAVGRALQRPVGRQSVSAGTPPLRIAWHTSSSGRSCGRPTRWSS